VTVAEAKAAADELGRKLLPKQRQWADKYLLTGNATEAAIAAGYARSTAAVQGSKLRSTPKIAEYLAARQNQLFAELGVNEGWVGRRFVEVYDRCMQATPHMVWDSDARDYVPDGTWVFDAKGAISALTALGKTLGMFQPAEGVETTAQSIEDWLKEQKELGEKRRL